MLFYFTFIFFINSYLCTNLYCDTCSSTGCSSSIENYMLINGQCKYKRSEGCEFFNSKNICTECTDGFKMDFSRKMCVPGVELCADIIVDNSDNLSCLSCYEGYTLTSATTCEKCKSYNPSCLVSDSTCTLCSVCAPGYYIDNNKCISIGNCQYPHTSTPKICSSCIAGYYLDETTRTCKKGNITNCIVYYDAIKCTTCESTYYYTSGECQQYFHCLNVGNTGCNFCEYGYGLKDGHCVKCNSNCIECFNDSDVCKTCQHGYGVINGKCVRCNSACKSCDSTSSEICTDCYEKTGLSSNTCVSCGANCLTCENDNPTKCTACEIGYVLTNINTCKKCGNNCTDCSATNTEICYDCQATYFLNGNSQCQTCQTVSCGALEEFQCGKCLEKCTFDNRNGNWLCNTNENCYIYDSARGKCTVCNDNYYLDNNYQCQKCNKNCVSRCTNNADQCNELEDIRLDENCLIFGQDHVC
ncbi:hypothetical protein EIN_314860 [Entamoeba invadens IP1]|uniref:EGF-like domain-containing protein n=1 Tax=Entamoeba invadens IP1 TaxID=370355 RepID=A0A0A1TZA9_ENTIV|nr:hypothetical protein EIN_314860 [Entamoeba invadens IP1]ELP86917.1 hypothetical protein EIN_314860 [Entamoeba invadens IP1]|eukprot:XP_004253688.1 hypothetical protein EIN_314860 [Entamoeba invadens IP1]